jgi:hypothetical protein
MDVMRLPHDVRRSIVRDYLSNWIVEVALPNALVDVVDFLDVTADNVSRGGIHRAFCLACEHGHTATAKWLVDTFALTADNARADDNLALGLACKGGHTATARWLVRRFSVTLEKILVNPREYSVPAGTPKLRSGRLVRLASQRVSSARTPASPRLGTQSRRLLPGGTGPV